jgi:cyanophycin synthetase
LTLESVVPEGTIVPLKKTANLSTGGTSTDVTDKVHPYNVFMAERIARIVNLDVCGIDIVAKDITIPINGSNGAIIEVNAGPGFRMHTHPFHGKPRNVAKPVIDMLFKDNGYSRIPIVAVTGTNGKTTTVRLIAAIAQHAGYKPGFTTTEGIYIDGQIAMRGDCSGPQSAKIVLSDPLVDFAVLECARGGILRSGLAFDKCTISIVTNVTEDHLGLDGIHTMEEVLPKSTFEDGYAILNAEDERVLAMKDNLKCNVVLFSTNPENPGIMSHCDSGGITVTIENGNYTICEGKKKWIVMPVNDIPLTFEGTAGFMVQNILPAIAAAYLSGFGIDAIRDALASFTPSPELTPGRMNVFDFGNFKLMLDYAHNAGAFVEIEKYMSGVDAKRKVCIIAATGDRRDDDIRNLGNYAARIFDEIIIRHDKDSRGQNNDRLTELLMEGIRKDGHEKQVTVISDEYEAISYAVGHAQPGTFIFVCADKVWDSIDMIRELQAAFV